MLVIFGFSGDLTKRKLLPAVYGLLKAGKIDRLAIVGVSRSPLSLEDVSIANKEEALWQKMLQAIYYFPFDFTQTKGYDRLKEFIVEIEQKHQLHHRIFYLATLPQYFVSITENVAGVNLTQESADHWCRVVYEKPFGWDLTSAREINHAITQYLSEEQIYRIDHYLGKEMVSAIPLVRFTNRILEPLWNKDHLESVQIVLSEKVGLEGRGRYYDTYGALKDMVQSHMLQLVGLVGMEAPRKLVGEDIRQAKTTVLEKVKVTDFLLGQYEGYQHEPGVGTHSQTETFAALRLEIDNPRWSGVPFFLKTGKHLDQKESSIHLKFKMVECLLTVHCPSDSNYLTLKLEPDLGVFLEMNAKTPWELSQVAPVHLSFAPVAAPDAYEILLGEIMSGNQSLFVRHDEIEAAWKIVDMVTMRDYPVFRYRQGSKGPAELQQWNKLHKVKWRA